MTQANWTTLFITCIDSITVVSTELSQYGNSRFLKGAYHNQFNMQGIILSFPFLNIEFFHIDYVRIGGGQRSLSHIKRILTEAL